MKAKERTDPARGRQKFRQGDGGKGRGTWVRMRWLVARGDGSLIHSLAREKREETGSRPRETTTTKRREKRGERRAKREERREERREKREVRRQKRDHKRPPEVPK